MAKATQKVDTETGEVTEDAKSITERALAQIKPGEQVVQLHGGVSFRVKKQVTRPVLSQEDGQAYYVMFQGPMVLAPDRAEGKGKRENGEPKEPPVIADILNLATGQEQTLVCGAMLVRELEDKYDLGGVNEEGEDTPPEYVGLSFALKSELRALKGRSGQRMRHYDIVELEAVETPPSV